VTNTSDISAITSKFLTSDETQQGCNKLFANMSVPIPSQPQINNILKFGGWSMNPTQTFFSNGDR
jgi:hypothetical protein